MLEITPLLQIPDSEFTWSFARSGGPGGPSGPSPQEQAAMETELKFINAGFEAVERLPGNVGYLQSATGIYLKISFPYIRKLLERTDYVKIIRADRNCSLDRVVNPKSKTAAEK